MDGDGGRMRRTRVDGGPGAPACALQIRHIRAEHRAVRNRHARQQLSSSVVLLLYIYIYIYIYMSSSTVEMFNEMQRGDYDVNGVRN